MINGIVPYKGREERKEEKRGEEEKGEEIREEEMSEGETLREERWNEIKGEDRCKTMNPIRTAFLYCFEGKAYFPSLFHHSHICHLFSALFFLMIFSKVDGGPIVLQTECTVDIGNEVFHDLLNMLKNSRCIFWRLLLTFPISFRHFSVTVLQQLSIFYFYFTLSPISFHWITFSFIIHISFFIYYSYLFFHLLFIFAFSFIIHICFFIYYSY